MNLVLVKPSLQELRQLIGATENLQRERSSFTLFREGLPKGALIEMSGPGKTAVVAAFLQEHPEMKVAWIEKEMSVNPYALFQKGVKTDSIVFIEAGKQLSWCLNQALQSGCFQVVVTEASYMHLVAEEKDLRRYQLLAERSQTHFFLLAEALSASWVANLQLKITKKKFGFNIETIKKRGIG